MRRPAKAQAITQCRFSVTFILQNGTIFLEINQYNFFIELFSNREYFVRMSATKTKLLLLFFLGFLLHSAIDSLKDGGAVILKKIDRDGNVTYYNRPAATHKKELPPSKFDVLIKKYSTASGIDPYLVKCVIKVESNFNPEAVSVAGAMGLMQLMQSTARMYKVKDPLDPEENIRAGTSHLKVLLNYFNYDIPLSLAAYHAGMGRVRKHNAIPPIRSTVKYVNRIMSFYRGKGNYASSVRRLYRRIDRHGDVIFYNRKNTNLLDK